MAMGMAMDATIDGITMDVTILAVKIERAWPETRTSKQANK